MFGTIGTQQPNVAPTTMNGGEKSKRARERVERDERPPTPNPSPQLSPERGSPLDDNVDKTSISTANDDLNDEDDSRNHPAKRQKTAEGEHRPLTPLTPPHSEQASSEHDETSGPPSPVSPRITTTTIPGIASESPRSLLPNCNSTSSSSSPASSSTINVAKRPQHSEIGFHSLPLEIRRRILIDALAMSIPELQFSLSYLSHNRDPRFLSPWLLAHYKRREFITAWCKVSPIWGHTLRPLLFHPLVVRDMSELSVLAGNAYVEGKGKKPYSQPRNPSITSGEDWASENRADVPWEKRRRITYQPAQKVKEVILWMARLPCDGAVPSSNEEQRWPKWYVQDYMRYDLESLGCSTVRVVAPNGAMLANALLATVPNVERIKTLHLEIYHSTGALVPSDERFFNVYRKNSATDHLCPRISMHAPYLEFLTLRNVCACEHLSLYMFQRLISFNMYFVNANPGLCNANEPSYWAEPYWWNRAIHDEVLRFRNMLIHCGSYTPTPARIMVMGWFDFLHHYSDGWAWQKVAKPMIWRQPGHPLFVEEHFWSDIIGGVKTLDEICRPQDEEDEEDEDEELSDDEAAAIDDDDVLQDSDEYATDEEAESWEERRRHPRHSMENVRQIQPRTQPPQRSPAPPARPLRILG